METVFNVGERVRVLLERCHRAEEGASCRALIAYNNDDNTFDIIYESNSYGLVEEGEVVARRIAPLETFELSSGKSSDGDSNALQEKERGNQLFQVKDFDAAGEYYRRALSMTAPSKPSVGSRVMVLNALGEYVTGTVCNADGGKTIDVIYDEEDSRGEDEEDGILLSRVIHLTGEEDLLHLQVVLFMNLAKVSLKLHRNGWAIRYSSASIGIIKNNKMLLPELSKKLIDAYYFRAKVFLIVNRPGRALAVRLCAMCYFSSLSSSYLFVVLHVGRQQHDRERRSPSGRRACTSNCCA